MIQDRLNQLVGLFKGRTERQKERLLDADESEEESPSACKWRLCPAVLRGSSETTARTLCC